MAALREPALGWTMTVARAAPGRIVDVAPVPPAILWLATGAAALLLAMGSADSRLVLVGWPANAPMVVPLGLASPLGNCIAAAASVPRLLLLCRVLAVFAGCFGLLRIVARLAAAEANGFAIGALLLGLAWLAGAPGLVSGVGSLGGIFTPTLAAVALLAVALSLVLDGACGAGIAMLGLVFDAQPEVALWGVAAMAGASIALACDRRHVLRAWLAGGAGALALAAPAIWWTGISGLLPGNALLAVLLPPPVWLAWGVPLAHWVLYASVLATGLAAFGVLGPDARAALGAFLGLLLVFAAGCAMPLLTANPSLLALRLEAADVPLQLLAMAATAAVLVRDLRGSGALRLALSVGAAACVLLHPLLLPVAALTMLARAAAAHGELLGIERRIPDGKSLLLRRGAATVVVIAAVAGGALRSGWLPH